MTEAPTNTHAADNVGNVLLINVADIDLGDRLRPVDPEWAGALGAIMLRDGQLTAIEVCKLPGRDGWRLVAGGHRLEGAKQAGMAYILAVEVSADKAERRLREVSENLYRRDLAPFDRATFVAEMVNLQKVRDGVDPDQAGRAISAQTRWQKALKADGADANDTMSQAYGWSDKVAEVVGVTRRTIERDLLLYKRLSPRTVEALRRKNHPALFKAAELKALAALEPDEQAHVVGLMIHASGSIKGAPFAKVADAISASRGNIKAPKPDSQKRLDAFLGAFSRMGVAEKKGALAILADLLPAGFKIVEGDA
jgi:hypothetical protein